MSPENETGNATAIPVTPAMYDAATNAAVGFWFFLKTHPEQANDSQALDRIVADLLEKHADLTQYTEAAFRYLFWELAHAMISPHTVH